MRQIIGYELRKLFRNRLVLFMLALFSVLNLYQIYGDYRKYAGSEKSWRDGYFAVYDEISGPWDNEKIRYVLAEYEKAKAAVSSGNYSTEPDQPGTHTGYVFGDWGLFEQIKDDMERMYHYGKTMAALTQKAADNAVFYEEKGNPALAKQNRLIAETYRDRSVTAFYDTLGISRYLKYDFSTLLILMLLIPLLSPLFAREHESGMHALLRLTPDFRKLPYAKLAACCTGIALVCLFFFTEDFLAFRYFYHIRGLSQPVWTLPDYFYTPLSCTVGGCLLLQAALKLLGFLVIGCVCTAFSAAAKHELIPFCCTFAVALVLVLTDAFAGSTVLSVLNPVTMLRSEALFRDFKTVSVFGRLVFSFRLPVLAALTEWLMLAGLTLAAGRLPARQRRTRHEI